VRGLSALQAGLCTLPVAVLIVVLAPISGRVVGRWGTRVPLLVAGASMALAGLSFTWLTPHTPLIALLGVYVLFGLGQGSINPPITYSAVSGMPRSMAGVAASVASTSRQTGVTLGVAVSGSLVGTTLAQGGLAFTSATHAVWWMVFGVGVFVAVLGLVTTSRWALDTAGRASALFGGFDDVSVVPARRESAVS